ncbi:hypothetical protein UG55_1016141 [Frankia sp. EI5c]|uniref:hypothetical protein n=1 Tax=Frankia sp. EI5c TaxID=683316 RepID=UPI0007C241E8|nr:hypothetical protein [Frankia sp. EI5c]OAA26477.1 hypothetical protein UG55_1016141 [Frankia sp. EI5c]
MDVVEGSRVGGSSARLPREAGVTSEPKALRASSTWMSGVAPVVGPAVVTGVSPVRATPVTIAESPARDAVPATTILVRPGVRRAAGARCAPRPVDEGDLVPACREAEAERPPAMVRVPSARAAPRSALPGSPGSVPTGRTGSNTEKRVLPAASPRSRPRAESRPKPAEPEPSRLDDLPAEELIDSGPVTVSISPGGSTEGRGGGKRRGIGVVLAEGALLHSLLTQPERGASPEGCGARVRDTRGSGAWVSGRAGPGRGSGAWPRAGTCPRIGI